MGPTQKISWCCGDIILVLVELLKIVPRGGALSKKLDGTYPRTPCWTDIVQQFWTSSLLRLFIFEDSNYPDLRNIPRSRVSITAVWNTVHMKYKKKSGLETRSGCLPSDDGKTLFVFHDYHGVIWVITPWSCYISAMSEGKLKVASSLREGPGRCGCCSSSFCGRAACWERFFFIIEHSVFNNVALLLTTCFFVDNTARENKPSTGVHFLPGRGAPQKERGDRCCTYSSMLLALTLEACTYLALGYIAVLRE